MNLKNRPFAVMGFTTLAVLLTCVFILEKFYVVSIAAGILIFVFSVFFKSIRERIFPFYIAGTLIFSGIMFYAFNEYDLKYAKNFADKTAVVEGVLIDKPDYSGTRYYYVLDLKEIASRNVNAKMRVSLPNMIDAEPYDTVKLEVKVYEIASESRDVQLYYQSKGIFLGGYAYNSDSFECEISKRNDNNLKYYLYLLREEINYRILDKLPNENGATIIAMLLGDKSALPDELNEKFREVGLAPIFAVSGLHLSVWIMGLYGFLDQLGMKKKLNSLIGILFTLLFMLLTGLTPSVCRSGLMMLLLLVGNLFYRKTDSLNSLGFAAFILCAVNPFIVADTGFLLSFSATLGIVTLMPVVNKYVFSKFSGNLFADSFKNIFKLIFVSVCATVGAFPVTVLFIGYISIFSVLSNLMVTYVATICMFLGGFTAITYDITPISDFTAMISGLLTKYLLWVVNLICEIPVTMISTENLFWKIGVLFAIAVVIYSICCFKNKAVFKSLCIGLTMVVVLCTVSSCFYYDNLTQIRILDVGNGVSAVISRNGEKILLAGKSDGYYKTSEITDSLNYVNRKPTNILLLGDRDAAEDSANLSLLANIESGKIVLPNSGHSIEKLIDKNKIIETTNAKINVWENGTVEYYSCDDYSLALCTFDKSVFLFLFHSKKYAQIDERFLSADYLICSGYIPNCISPKNYKSVILCGDEKIERPISEYVLSSGGNPLTSYKYEDVCINIRDSGEKIYLLED